MIPKKYRRGQKVLDYSKSSIVPEVIRNILRYKKSGSALDLGTGTGRHALFLAKKGFRVTALDSVRSKLVALREVARAQRLPMKCKHADMKHIKLREMYDVILASHSLHFLKTPQLEKAIEIIQTHTKPSGLNIIRVHTKENPKHHYRPHLFAKNELKKYYVGWKILLYRELWGQPFRNLKTGRPVVRHKAELIAKKSAI